jgi:multiple sugar transport system permease protein
MRSRGWARWRLHPTRLTVGLLLVLVLLAYVFPYAYLLSTSFKQTGATLGIPPSLLPPVWSLDNYLGLGKYPEIPQAFVNSAVIATMSTALALVLGVPAAYAISWYGTGAGRVFFIVALVVRMLPSVSIGIPLFLMLGRLGLIDTWIGVALAHTTISLPLAIWLLAGFFEAVPHELEEAARVDGCSRLGALARVVVPVVTGGIAVTAVFAFLASWNEYLFALLLTTNNAQTVPVVIAGFNTQYGVDWGTMTALSVIYSLPVVLLSLGLQRHVVSGMTLGAVKG